MIGTFEPWSFRRGPSAIGLYDYDVFVSYASPDVDIARRIADAMVSRGLGVFFAPATFRIVRSDDLSSATFWSSDLEGAMLHSCHFVGVVTSHYLGRPWCQLELGGFRNIRAANRSRTIALLATDVDDAVLPEDARADVVSKEPDAIPALVHSIVDKSALSMGQRAVPTACFTSLPLTSIKREAGWTPWGDGSRYDPDPPYEVYERCVRELMVLIRLGADIESLTEHFSGMTKWQERHVRDAIHDARYLAQRRVSPF